MFKRMTQPLKTVWIAISLTCLVGCCQPCNIDPIEPFNRGVYSFNKTVDCLIVKPVARMYTGVTPQPIRQMVSNFFQNLAEVHNILNDVLQGELCMAANDSARFVINTTWGIGGLFDVAGYRGCLPANNQDFGLTLAKWGCHDSPYVVLPLIGPSTVRDSIGWVADYYSWPPTYLKSVSVRNALLIGAYVNKRSQLLKIEPVLDDAVDEYTFIRDAYLQNRLYKICGECGIAEASLSQPVLVGPPE